MFPWDNGWERNSYSAMDWMGAVRVTISEGVRFSENYIPRGEPTSDSSRMRMRLYRLFTTYKLDDKVRGETIELALGVLVPWTSYGRDWSKFFQERQLRDLLDTITVVYRALAGSYSIYQKSWLDGVSVIFRQENVRYRVDSKGGVHFAIDGEFDHNQACTIAALQAARYGAARAHFEAGQRALDASPPQTREAIRQTFECVETIFKLMFSDVSQLGSSEIAKKLKPLIDSRMSGSERNAMGLWLKSLGDWINGAHQYRHGQGVEEPDYPSIQTAVLNVSLGSTYARWLAELDANINAQQA